jgi:TnpA family transposase
MIEGVIHHITEMEIDRQYVDSHGQSEVAFAFCRLLRFQLLPRLKAIHSQRLYRPDLGKVGLYKNLEPVMTRPIVWDIIRQQHVQWSSMPRRCPSVPRRPSPSSGDSRAITFSIQRIRR